MRFSDFLAAPKVDVSPPVPKIIPEEKIIGKQEDKPKLRSSQDESFSLVVEATLIEKRIRQELEAQFQREMDKTRQELESRFHQGLESEKKKSADQEKSLQLMKQAADQEQEKLRQERSRELSEYKKQMESVLSAAFEAERAKMKETLEIEGLKDKQTLQGFQKLLDLREKELNDARNSLRALSQPSDQLVTPPPPIKKDESREEVAVLLRDVSSPAPPARNELPSKIPPPSFSGLKPIEKIDETIPEVALQADPQAEALAISLRDQLVAIGEPLFAQSAQGRIPDLDPLKEILNSFLDLIQKRDLESMRLALEPYPVDNHFTYHAVNTAVLALILALEFSFSREEMMDLGLAAFLHDMGLVKVREDLNYPKKLTPQLEKEILDHPLKGAEMLKDILSTTALEAIMHHHEIGNGKGYPKGLMDQDIHIFAKIIHVIDSFEALIHERPYRKKPLEVNDAMKQLIDTGRGIYDRLVLKSLMVRVGLYPVMSYVELSNKQVGRVVRQNRQYPLSPVIQIEYDENGKKLRRTSLVDLSQSQFIHVSGPVKKETQAEGSYTASRFASTQPASTAESEKKKVSSEFMQHVISILLILTVILILVYVVIKI